MRRLNEHAIIRLFSKALDLKDLDDVALVGPAGTKRLAFKCDMLVKSTDVPPKMTAAQVARKSVVSCASDFACKGITPLAAMIALGLTSDLDEKYIRGLAAGFAAASKEFGVTIVGGDTNESNDLVIDCSMIGIAPDRIPGRSTARAGDLVITSGTFGLPPSGLKILLSGAKASSAFRKAAVDSVMMPRPAQEFGSLLSRHFSSSIDSSDGLALSLYLIAAQSGVDILLESLPSAPGLAEFAKANRLEWEDLVLYGGEEYRIVATIPRPKLAQAKASASKRGLDLFTIGRVAAGRGRVFLDNQRIENKGYTHFADNRLP